MLYQPIKLTMKKENEITFQLKYLRRNDIRELLKTSSDIIAINIIKQMAAKNVTQKSLAIAIHSDRSHLNRILSRHKKGITINVLSRIAFALDVSIADLATEQPKNPQYKTI